MAGVSFIATAYGPPWNAENGSGTTATGVKLPAAPTGQIGPPYLVAVDPSVIPLGSKLKIWPNPTGDPNVVWTAADTGGAIQGNRIDFLDLAGRASQMAWGRRPVNVTNSNSARSTPPTSTAPSSSTSTSSSSGVSTWVKLLLDVAFVAVGGALIYRGGKQALGAAAHG